MRAGAAGTARVPFRPQPGPRIRWPDAFGTRFMVFVDVEEEFDWSAPLDRAHRATTAMRAFPDAHRRFVDRGVPLTCMVDYPIATDPASVDILRAVIADGHSEIGTQLHPWVNPPHEEEVGRANSFPGNLPRPLQRAKIATLTTAIEQAFGARPRAFRAGRYGLGPETLSVLADAGYRLDSSVRARYDYRAEGGPDYTQVGNAAWRAEGLVELPLTTMFTGAAGRGGAGLYRLAARVPHGPGVLARARLVQRVALTPEGMPVAAVLDAIARAAQEQLRLLVFSFHSPTLAPGHTPYVRDEADRRAFWSWWEQVLNWLDRLNIRPASLAAVLAAAG